MLDHMLAAVLGVTCFAAALFMFRSWHGLLTFDCKQSEGYPAHGLSWPCLCSLV